MDELFGISTQQLTWVLLGVFAAGALILAVMAARDRTSFRMAVRNVPRRKTQTALIVMGLMLATLLFSAAFTTGDTLTNSLRIQALENIGRVDVILRAKQPEANDGASFGPGAGGPEVTEARESYFDGDLTGRISERLAHEESVAGVAPLAKETVPVTFPETGLSEPRVDVLGMEASSMKGFGKLATDSGKILSVGDLEADEVYVSAELAKALDIGKGDEVEASLVRPSTKLKGRQPLSEPQSKLRPEAGQGRPRGQEARMPPAGVQSSKRPPGPIEDRLHAASKVQAPPAEAKSEERPPEFVVAGIYSSGANPAPDASMVMPLHKLQERVGEEGRVNEVLVTHGGPAVEGGEHTGSTVEAIEPLL